MLDLLSTTSSWQPVFYACHDPPVIAYQAATIEDFLRDTVAMWQVDRRSAVDIVHEDVVMQIWRTNPHLQTAARLLESTDAVAQAFAMSLPPQALVIDLRHPQFGRGFSWGPLRSEDQNPTCWGGSDLGDNPAGAEARLLDPGSLVADAGTA